MSEPTPRPWKQFSGNMKMVQDDTGQGVACCRDKDVAELVVREHNAHDDLVAACEALTSAVDEWQCEDPDSPHLDPIRRSLTLGLAAIAKAKPV